MRVSHPHNIILRPGTDTSKLIEGSRAFKNKHPLDYESELSQINPQEDGPFNVVTQRGQAKKLIESFKKFKWVYNVYGQLDVASDKASHAVCGQGKQAFSAGEGLYFKDGGLWIANFSGHYFPTLLSNKIRYVDKVITLLGTCVSITPKFVDLRELKNENDAEGWSIQMGGYL